jgi:hypothetical protein
MGGRVFRVGRTKMNRFSPRSSGSFHSLCLRLVCCGSVCGFLGVSVAQTPPSTAYFVVSGSYRSDYQSQSNSSVAYQGAYDETQWHVSQAGLSVVGSFVDNSARVSRHVDYSWLNAPLAGSTGEQWGRSGSEAIGIFVPGPPGTPFSLTYSYSATVSASDLSSPCSSGYTLAYFQGPQTAYVTAKQAGLTPSKTLSARKTITGVTQSQKMMDPSGTGQTYSLAWTLSESSGVQTGDSGTTGCTPPQFTGSASVDSTLLITVNGILPAIAPYSLKEEIAPIQPLLNQQCAALAGHSVAPSATGTRVTSAIALPACLASQSYQAIVNDPPDANYTVITQPAIPYLPPLAVHTGDTQAELNAVNALTANQLQAAAYAKAIAASLERSEGAYFANDAYWKQKQDQAGAQFALQLGAILDVQTALLTATKNALVNAAVGPYIIAASDLAELNAFIANKGIPASLLQELNTLGVTASNLVALESLVLAQKPDSFPKIFPDMLTDPALMSNLDQTSDALLKNRSSAADVSGSITVVRSKFTTVGTLYTQTLTLTNTGVSALQGPVSLVLDKLSTGVNLSRNSGTILCSQAPDRGSVFVNVDIPANTLEPGQSAPIALQFNNPSGQNIMYNTRVLAAEGIR